MTARCRSCSAEIVWVETERGKRMPVDAAPAEAGSILLRDRAGEAPLALFGVPDEVFPEEPRYTSHFATCPDAGDWRRT